MRTYERTPIPTLFWSKVQPIDGCLVWTGSGNNGYGRFRETDGKNHMAHRWAYEYVVGPIPDGLDIDHLCRNRLCVNPEHLEPVTPAQNTARGMGGKHKRQKTHCPRGHEYTFDNIYWNGAYRHCRRCVLDRYHSRSVA